MTLCRLPGSISFNMWPLLQVKWYLWLVLADYKFCGSLASFLGCWWRTVREGICACCLSVHEFFWHSFAWFGSLWWASMWNKWYLSLLSSFLYDLHLPFYLSILHVINECMICLRRDTNCLLSSACVSFHAFKTYSKIVYSNKDSTEPASSIIRDGLVLCNFTRTVT